MNTPRIITTLALLAALAAFTQHGRDHRGRRSQDVRHTRNPATEDAKRDEL